MNKEIQEKIKQIESHRSNLIYNLIESDKVYMPEVLITLVHEIRGVSKVLKILRGIDNQRKGGPQ